MRRGIHLHLNIRSSVENIAYDLYPSAWAHLWCRPLTVGYIWRMADAFDCGNVCICRFRLAGLRCMLFGSVDIHSWKFKGWQRRKDLQQISIPQTSVSGIEYGTEPVWRSATLLIIQASPHRGSAIAHLTLSSILVLTVDSSSLIFIVCMYQWTVSAFLHEFVGYDAVVLLTMSAFGDESCPHLEVSVDLVHPVR